MEFGARADNSGSSIQKGRNLQAVCVAGGTGRKTGDASLAKDERFSPLLSPTSVSPLVRFAGASASLASAKNDTRLLRFLLRGPLQRCVES
jgi:hypothetical protein